MKIDGVLYLRRRRGRGRCDDCGAQQRYFHHLGCDVERCPRCGRQLISRGCWTDGFEEPGDDETEWYDDQPTTG